MECIRLGDCGKRQWSRDPAVLTNTDGGTISQLLAVIGSHNMLGYYNTMPCKRRLASKLCKEKVIVREIMSFENTIYQ